MQPIKFEQALGQILEKDQRFQPEAYFLVKEALDFTIQRISDEAKGVKRHITGSEFVLGFRDFVLQEYGPMSSTLLEVWGLSRCADIGEIVFNLIEVGIFGKQDSDNKDDFAELYEFKEAFRAPFRPTAPVSI